MTIDLSGFTLEGGNTAGVGISVAGTQAAIRITGGNIRAWGTGIAASQAVYSRVDNVTVTGTGLVAVDVGLASVIENCNVSANFSVGVRVRGSTLRNCTVIDNGTSGVVVFDYSSVHGNHLHNNNVSAVAGYASINVTGTRSTIYDNVIGATQSIRFDPGSVSNWAYRNLGCPSIIDAGTSNVHPYEFDQLDTAPEGHTGLSPSLNPCI